MADLASSRSRTLWPALVVTMLVVILSLGGGSVVNSLGQRTTASDVTDDCLIGDNCSISQVHDRQILPVVAYDSLRNSYLIVWEQGRSGPSSRVDIYARHGSNVCGSPESGTPIASSNSIQATPAVAYNDSTGESVIVWEESGDDGWNIYGHRFADEAVGGAFDIAVSDGDQRAPAIACSGSQYGCLVVWEDFDWRSATDKDIFGRRILSTPEASEGEVYISRGPGAQSRPAITYNSDDEEYLVVWTDERSGKDSDIYGQRVSAATGNVVGGNQPISTAENLQAEPDVAYDGSRSEYLVVWTDFRVERVLSSNSSGIYGRFFTNHLTPTTTSFPLSSNTGWQKRPAIVYHEGADEYLVAWEQQAQDTPAYSDIYGVRIKGHDSSQWPVCIISEASHNQGYPAVTANDVTPEYMVVWHDKRNRNSTAPNIFAQRVRTSDPSPSSVTPTGTLVTPTATPTPTHTSSPTPPTPPPTVTVSPTGTPSTQTPISTPTVTVTPTGTLPTQTPSLTTTATVTGTPPTPTRTATVTMTPLSRATHYLSVIGKNYTSPDTPFCDGEFEMDNLRLCWRQKGVLHTSVVGSEDPNNPFNSFAARLGNPDYSQDEVPEGRASIYQTLTVPSSSTKLEFRYFVYSYDIKEYDGVVYDYFEVSVDDGSRVLLSVGNPASNTHCTEEDLWDTGEIRTQIIDLGKYGVSAGDEIEIWFSNWNRSKAECNTWSYIDDVVVKP